MTAMLLAAGRSTRLGELGSLLPKPLVPVCGYPAIRFGIEACRCAGLRDVVINLHHHGQAIQDALGDGSAFGVGIRYSEEPDLLGTGGGLTCARRLFSRGPVLVMNAKVVAAVDITSVLSAHAAAGAESTMVLRDDPDPRRWGAIAADEEGTVVGVLDARSPAAHRGSVTERMFTGIHVVEPALLDRLPTGVSDIIRQAYMPAVREGARVAAFVTRGYFAEHSTPERYLEGNLALLRDPGILPHPPGPLVGVDSGAVVASGAVLRPPLRIAAGAKVEAGAAVGPEAVVCPGAVVAAGAVVRHSVVWPGAVARGDVEDAVVTAAGIVTVVRPPRP